MRKLLSLLTAVLLAGSMWAAVGNLYYTATFLKGTSAAGDNISGYDNTGDYTTNGITWVIPGNNTNGDYIRIGGKKIESVERVVKSKATINSEIAKIVISHNGKTRDNVVLDSVMLTVASDASFTNNVETKIVKAPTVAKSTAGTIQFLADSKWATNRYYKFSFFVTNPDNSNGGIDVQSIAFYSYMSDDAPSITAEKIAFGLVATTALPVAKNAELTVVGANLTNAITYSYLGSHVEATGTLTATGGTLNVTLTATAEGELSDTIVLTSGTTVTKVAVEAKVAHTTGNGSKENPYTVADVVKLNNGIGNDKYWVVGYIVGCAANGGLISAAEDVQSNIAIGDAADQTTNVVPVELPSGTIRTALNIVDTPANKGKKLKVHGQLISYFQFTGVKAIDEYEWVSNPTSLEAIENAEKAVKTIVNGQLFIEKNGKVYNILGTLVK